MRHPLEGHPRGTVCHLINSYFHRDVYLDLQLHLVPSRETDDDVAIAERIIRAFQHARQREAGMCPTSLPNQGVWEMVKHEFHGEAYRLLLNGDPQPLARYLANALRTSWGYGLGPGPAVFDAFSSDGDPRNANILIVKDRMVSLAVALGLLPQEISEQGRYGENIHVDFAELVRMIELETSMKIGVLPAMGAFGVLYEDRVVDARTSEDVYAAHRVRSLTRSGMVGEIGGGFGGTSLQFVRAGLATTVFDLPIINVLQAFFLIKSLGPEDVALYGESVTTSKVSVLPWWCFYDSAVEFDVVFNRDSLAEIPRANALRYFAEIKQRNVSLLSINQEAESASGQEGVFQVSTSKLAREAGLRQTMRCPYWIRRGFVEEMFAP